MLSDSILENMLAIHALHDAWKRQIPLGDINLEELQVETCIQELKAYAAVQDGAFITGGVLSEIAYPSTLREVWLLIQPFQDRAGLYFEREEKSEDPYIKSKLKAELRNLVNDAGPYLEDGFYGRPGDVDNPEDGFTRQAREAIEFLADFANS